MFLSAPSPVERPLKGSCCLAWSPVRSRGRLGVRDRRGAALLRTGRRCGNRRVLGPWGRNRVQRRRALRLAQRPRAGAVVVVLSAPAAWFSMFFVPVPGGSAGAFEVVGLPLIILIAGAPAMSRSNGGAWPGCAVRARFYEGPALTDRPRALEAERRTSQVRVGIYGLRCPCSGSSRRPCRAGGLFAFLPMSSQS